MARESVCAKLHNGQNSDCVDLKRAYYQQAVLINLSDIDRDTQVIQNPTLSECHYTVQFSLKEGKTGYFFQGPEGGSSFFGTYDKTRSDLGIVQYTHNASILIVGADEEAKCILDALDKGKYAVAFQFTDGTVEIYGLKNGLSTADYTYDVQGGGGGTVIVLSSSENAPEDRLPYVYKSLVPGNEGADFDDAFANTGS